MSRIKVDYAEARKYARELRALMEECEEIKRSLQSVMSSIPEAWQGSAQEAYLNLVSKRIREVETMANDAGSLATHINSIADSFEATEVQLKNGMRQQGGGRGF